jgi:predicted transcriptional regulator
LAKVARGLDAAERGDVVPHDEIEREFLAGE